MLNVTSIIIATLVIGGIGLFVGVFLGIAAIKFKVTVDEKEEMVLAALPGNNCGGCGYAGCSGLAVAIAKGQAEVGACPVGGSAVAEEIAKIMGVEANSAERMVAHVMCKGDCNNTTVDYDYSGVEDCRMLAFVPNGGPKSCNDGCLGYGSCVKVCPFNAISIENGVAVVDKEKCKACNKCIAICPKNLIELVPYDAQYIVECSSNEKGPVTMKACKVGCIACSLCVKNCPKEAITITDFHAKIDQSKCVGCGICLEKCPKKTIVKNK